MITVTIEKRYGTSGATTVRARITAATIERAVKIAGPGARVKFPINGDEFFSATNGVAKGEATGEASEGIDYAAMTTEQIEAAYEAGLPGAYSAYLDVLKDDLGEDAFEAYALKNCLV